LEKHEKEFLKTKNGLGPSVITVKQKVGPDISRVYAIRSKRVKKKP